MNLVVLTCSKGSLHSFKIGCFLSAVYLLFSRSSLFPVLFLLTGPILINLKKNGRVSERERERKREKERERERKREKERERERIKLDELNCESEMNVPL